LINLGFLLRENLAAIFIIPSSWGSQLDGEKLSTPYRIRRRRGKTRRVKLRQHGEDAAVKPMRYVKSRQHGEAEAARERCDA
jgi:hypothetical protein